jgi:hypothetical protein
MVQVHENESDQGRLHSGNHQSDPDINRMAAEVDCRDPYGKSREKEQQQTDDRIQSDMFS